MRKNFNLFLLFTTISINLFSDLNGAPLTGSGCPNFCSCDLTSNVLTISCTQGQLIQNFNIPDPSLNNQLYGVYKIVASNSLIQNFPSNICQYRQTLTSLDLSLNQISGTLSSSLIQCLVNLQNLTLTGNLISALTQDAFDNTTSLVSIDLSNNKITQIPTLLFYKKGNKLKNLNLRNNLLTSLDPWYFYLSSIQTIDLSFNKISTFTNKLNWNLYGQSFLTQGRATIYMDLRYNNLKSFDDSILLLYDLCAQINIVFYMQLLYNLQLEQNQFNCSCQNSYNLLSFVQQSIASQQLDPSQTIFNAKCAFPDQYRGLSIFTFASIQTDSSCFGATPFSNLNCPLIPTTTTTTTTTSTTTTSTTTVPSFTLPQNLPINTPQLQLADDGSGVLLQITHSGAWIAGMVIGFLGAIVLFLLLLYCICPIEILSVLFDCIPFFYSCCPCKSGQVRNKEYDLFISYNKAENENWVRKSLVPNIQSKYLVENFILHYNEENKKNEIFNDYVQQMMSKSSCILFVLSDSFLIKEWNNKPFRDHVRHLITKERTRFVCIQMHDVSDDAVEEYFRKNLQLPYFISLENDEFLFWKKLGYHLYTNDLNKQVVVPVEKTQIVVQPSHEIEFDRYNINRPIIHLHGKTDPFANDKPKQNLKMNFKPVLNYEYENVEKEPIVKKKEKKEKKKRREQPKEKEQLVKDRTPTPPPTPPPLETIQPRKEIQVYDENLETPPIQSPRSPSPEPLRQIEKAKKAKKVRHDDEETVREEVQRHVRIDFFETKKDKIYNPFEDKIHDAEIPVSDINHQAKARRLSFESQKSQVTTADSYFNYEAHKKKRGSIEDLDYRIMNTGYGRGANSVGFAESNSVVRNSLSPKIMKKHHHHGISSANSAQKPQDYVNLPQELQRSPYLNRSNSGSRAKKISQQDHLNEFF